MAAGAGPPLPSGAEPRDEAEEEELETEIDREDAKPRPQSPGFKLSTFVYTFLFLLGILMIFDTGTRYGVSIAFDHALSPLIGFGGHFPLLTMFLAASLEMALTAVAYNFTTDWIKAAKVQKWSGAFRKVQMAALRSGKKDRIEALQAHQQTLTRLSTEVSFAQLKGMAITWFLVIALYSWVFLFLASPSPATLGYNTITSACFAQHGCAANASATGTVNVPLGGGLSMNLLGPLFSVGSYKVQLWFILFTVYTVPLSLIFRRLLKHYSLRRYLARQPAAPAAPRGGAGEQPA